MTFIHFIPSCFVFPGTFSNLFMAGRNISVTHIALGTVRVQRTTGMMGEVVGVAAYLCKKQKCLPRDVYEHHLDEFMKLVGKRCAIRLNAKAYLYYFIDE